MKIWFVSVNRVSDNDFIRYGLRELLENGVEINVIDVSDLLWGTRDVILKNDIFFRITYCKKPSDFNSIMLDVSPNDVVLCGGVLSPRLHSILSNTCKYVGLQTLGAISNPTASKNKSKFKLFLSRVRSKGLFNKIVRKIHGHFVFKHKPYYFVQRAGYESSKCYPGINEHTKIIECQSYDIYQYLLDGSKGDIVTKGKGYILWIDQAIPLHTDTLKCGGDISHLSDDYFNRIKKLLISFEIEFKLKVIVSLHPRIASNPRYLNVWKGWNTVIGNTNNYIKNADICVTHNSTAIHTVAYLSRPLIIVKDKLLSQQGYDNGSTDYLSTELRCNVIQSDDLESNIDINLNVNTAAYKEYVCKFVSNVDSKKPVNSKLIYEMLKSQYYK